MDKIVLFLIIGTIFVMVSSIVLSQINGGPIITQNGYEYEFPMLNDTCDIHMIRPSILYYCDFWADWVSIMSPYIYVGMNAPLNSTQEQCLNQTMQNWEVCFIPDDIQCIITIDRRPQLLIKALMNATDKKVLYYSEGIKANLLLNFIPTATQRQNALEEIKKLVSINCTL